MLGKCDDRVSAAKKHRTEKIDEEELLEKVLQRNRRDWPVLHDDGDHFPEGMLRDHDGPHDSAKLEWWYVNAHLADGISVFAAFFRMVVDETYVGTGPNAALQRPLQYASCVNWALVDRAAGTYECFGRIDHDTPGIVDSMVKKGRYRGDEHVVKALQELARQDKTVPLPDKLMSKAGTCVHVKGPGSGLHKGLFGGFAVDFDGNTFGRDDAKDAPYKLSLWGERADGAKVELTMTLAPTKPAVACGVHGVVATGKSQLHQAENMFYYCFPRCRVHATLNDKPMHGEGWIDHEFGGTIAETQEEYSRVVHRNVEQRQGMEVQYEWAALQLSNDTEVSVTLLLDPSQASPGGKPRVVSSFAVVREGTQASFRVDGAELVSDPASTWTSPATGVAFPTAWTVRFEHPNGGTVELKLTASVKASEFIMLAAKPSYWEGHALVEGTYKGAAVTGHAFAECHGQQPTNAAEMGFALLNTALCMPLEAQVLAIHPASNASATVTPEALVPLAAPLVEMACAMLAAQAPAGSPAPTPAQKKVMAAICAAHGYVQRAVEAAQIAHPNDEPTQDAAVAAAQHTATAFVDAAWRASKDGIPNDFKRLLLRAWCFAQSAVAPASLAEKRVKAAAAALASANAGNATKDDLPFVDSASDADLATPASAALIAALRERFTGAWQLDKSRTQPALSGVLAAQGVNFVVRQFTDRLAPLMTTTVTEAAVESNIKTAVSNDDVKMSIDGSGTSWFSKGRGDLTTHCQVQDGGRTLYMRTFVPPDQKVAVEHKWLRSVGGGTQLQEEYRYDPKGRPGDDSVTCSRFWDKQPE